MDNIVQDKHYSKQELIDEGLKVLEDQSFNRKNLSKVYKGVKSDIGEDTRFLANAYRYLKFHEQGWTGSPLELDPKVAEKDEISKVMIKFLEVVEAMVKTNHTNNLKPYFRELGSMGIYVDFAEYEKNCQSYDLENELNDIAHYDVLLEKNKNQLNEYAEEAESINFTTRGKYQAILSLIKQKQDGKNVDDKIQDEHTKMALITNGLDTISEM